MGKQKPFSKATSLEREYWTYRATDCTGWICDMYGSFHLAQMIQKLGLHLRPWKRVLEIGCGGLGIGLLWLFPKAGLRVGLDVLEIVDVGSEDVPLFGQVVTCAREDVKYVRAVGESLPFAPGSFDLIVCNNVLDHVLDPGRILRGAAAALMPDGVLCLGVDCSSSLGYAYRRVVRRISKSRDHVLHPHDFTFAGLTRQLKRYGFVPLDSSQVSWRNALCGPRGRKCWILKRSKK